MLRKLRVPLTLTVLALFFYWWLRRYWELEPAPSDSLMGVRPEVKKTFTLVLQQHPAPIRPAPAPEIAPVEPADLKRIEGIGPKISSVLQAAGITTFAALAATEVSRLEEVLEAESPRLLRLADPATWPEQARLAAAGDWEGLEAFQSTLKGG